uniref:Uncharacterized protein n=1 Tax=Solanum lycopersicum TaxID=4081 RepID=A0A3Q7I2R8_SOLLC
MLYGYIYLPPQSFIVAFDDYLLLSVPSVVFSECYTFFFNQSFVCFIVVVLKRFYFF